MITSFRLVICALYSLSVLILHSSPALGHVLDQVWEQTNYERFGFSMLMPSDSYLGTKRSDELEGWKTLSGNMEGATFLGVMRADIESSAAELDAQRAKLSGWPAMSWDTIDDGADSAGWTWYRTFRAGIHGDTYYGGYGVGANGSYVFLVKTSDGDFATHHSDYANWFKSITLVE